MFLLIFGTTMAIISPITSLYFSSPSIAPATRNIVGFKDIIQDYDVLILDQWGVLHDGKKAYPGAIECLQQIKAANKKVILLSNSSKRKDKSYQGLAKTGFYSNLFDDIVTSGDIGWQLIHGRNCSFMSAGSHSKKKELLKVVLFGNDDDDEEYLSSCDCELASSPAEADFVLCRGSFTYRTANYRSPYTSPEMLLEHIHPYLSDCAEAGLPMLVTNPDFHRPGSHSPMPGLFASLYSSLKGKDGYQAIEYIGKPYASVYSSCFASAEALLGPLKEGSARRKFLAVGDSLEHDIEGARRAGIDSVWIMNGVHCRDLKTEEGSSQVADSRLASELLAKLSPHLRPSYSIPCFQW